MKPIPLKKEGDPECSYVRSHYHLLVRRGDRVQVAGGAVGRVCGGTMHVFVQIDGKKHAAPWHPDDVKLLECDEAGA